VPSELKAKPDDGIPFSPPPTKHLVEDDSDDPVRGARGLVHLLLRADGVPGMGPPHGPDDVPLRFQVRARHQVDLTLELYLLLLLEPSA